MLIGVLFLVLTMAKVIIKFAGALHFALRRFREPRRVSLAALMPLQSSLPTLVFIFLVKMFPQLMFESSPFSYLLHSGSYVKYFSELMKI